MSITGCVMDAKHSCRCCLEFPSDKDLKTPYTHFGKTEIYADMLKQCFDIHLVLGSNSPRGICSVCVGHLRDARDFKMRVQHSQQLLLGIGEVPVEKLETVSDDETREVLESDEEQSNASDDGVYLLMMSDDETSKTVTTEPASASARDQLSKLERLRGDQGRTSTHSEDKTFGCTYCGKIFRSLSALRKHKQKMCSKSAKLQHKRGTGEKPFKCPYCEYETNANHILRRHVMRHTGEKPFKCDLCDYRVSRHSELRRHGRIHTGEKPYECSYCEYKCTDSATLRNHTMRHTGEKPFKCELCDYRSSRKFLVRKHQLVHAEKPFQCHCGFKCSHINQYKFHLRVHNGGKPHACDQCDYKCEKKLSLDKHKQNVHKPATDISD